MDAGVIGDVRTAGFGSTRSSDRRRYVIPNHVKIRLTIRVKGVCIVSIIDRRHV